LSIENDRFLEWVRSIDTTGSFGNVDEVRFTGINRRFGNTYARKIIAFERDNFTDQIMTEIRILKKLCQKHIVSTVLTYELASKPTENLTFGILMPTVADCNLKTYLRVNEFEIRRTPPDVGQNLQTWLGCLAVGLAFIHSQKVRHMDIKPANILIKGNSVLYSDFGISKVFKDQEGTTTDGTHVAGTRLYCAPEAVPGSQSAGMERNSKTDVFSLGCVYMEMLTVLFGKTVDQFAEFRGPKGNQAYRTHLNESLQWLDSLRRHSEEQFITQNIMDRMYPLCTRMTLKDLRVRPGAAEVADIVCGPSPATGQRRLDNCFCENDFHMHRTEELTQKRTHVSPYQSTQLESSRVASCGSGCSHYRIWSCCECGSPVLIDLCPDRCPICEHYRDDSCQLE
jgi:serine/threonine protein kinase